MDRTVPYDATKKALLNPEQAEVLWETGDCDSITTICCQCSRLAYKHFESAEIDAKGVRDSLRRAEFSDVEFLSDRAHAIAARSANGKVRVLAFRGTNADDPSDISTDAEAVLVPLARDGRENVDVRVHLGFQNALDSIRGKIMRWLHDHPAAMTVFTGHSLGAALATLAACLCDEARVITFGSPKVGDDAFAQMLSRRNIVRYVDCCDMVCQVPPPLLGYSHAGTQIYINRFGEIDASANEDTMENDQAKARLSYLARYAWKRERRLPRSGGSRTGQLFRGDSLCSFTKGTRRTRTRCSLSNRIHRARIVLWRIDCERLFHLPC